MMRRRVAPAFYPLPLVGDPVDRDSRPRLHDFGRAGTTSGLYPFAITLLHNFRENSLCSVPPTLFISCSFFVTSVLSFPSVLPSMPPSVSWNRFENFKMETRERINYTCDLRNVQFCFVF